MIGNLSDWIKDLKVGDPVLLHERGFGGGTVKGTVTQICKGYIKVNDTLINMNGLQRGGQSYSKAIISPWNPTNPNYLKTRKARCIKAITSVLEFCELVFLETTIRLIQMHIKEAKGDEE